MSRAARTRWAVALPVAAIFAGLWLAGHTWSQTLVQVPPQTVNLVVNPDFRKVTKGLPDFWYFDSALAQKGSIRIAPEGAITGTRSLCLIPNARNNDRGKPFALAQMIYPEPFLGHKLLVQASMIVSGGATAYAHLFALSHGRPVARATISRTLAGAGFATQQDALTVPPSTDQLFFLISTGSTAGSACFSDIGVFVADPNAPTAATPSRSAVPANLPTATLPPLAVTSGPATVAPVAAPAEGPVGPNLIQNPEFRVTSGKVPDSWLLDPALAPKGSVIVDPAGPGAGQAALCLTPNFRNSDKAKPFGLAQIFSAVPYRGKHLDVRASIRVAQGGTGFVHLFAIAGDHPVGNVTFTQSVPSPAFVTQENVLVVPGNADRLLFAVTTNTTTGHACFGDLFVREQQAPRPDRPRGPNPAVEASIRINAAKVLRNIPAGLYGTNVEWVRNGNGIWDSSTNQPRPEIVRRMREAGVSVIRYPGGGLADHFHWRDSIGPVSSRPVRPHVLDPESSKLVFGTDEFIKLCRLVGAEPLITVNIAEGDAREAADWVAYCNRPVNPERAKNGSGAPYHVKYWEIGNEQYINNRSAGLPNSYLTPDEYARRFLEFAAAMKAVDPSIVVGAIGGSNFGAYRLLQDDDWDVRLLGAAAPKISFLSIHNGYAPLVGTTPGLRFFDVYRAMLAFPAQAEQNLASLSAQLDANGGASKRTGLAVTEWGPLFAAEVGSVWTGHTKTLGSALYAASIFNVFLRSPRVEMATYLKLTENNYMGWLYPNGEAKPTFEVLQLYHQHMGSRLIETGVGSPGFRSPAIGSVAAASNTPYLDAVSSLDDSGSRLTLIAVNRGFDNSLSTSIKIEGFQPASSGKEWQLTADCLDANNGEDLDPRLHWARQAEGPGRSCYSAGHPGNVVPGERAITGLSTAFYFTFPPQSVTVLQVASR